MSIDPKDRMYMVRGHRDYYPVNYDGRYYSEVSGKASEELQSLYIAAPRSMFYSNVSQVSGSHELRNMPRDPVVLCPVDGGYLIIAAWGQEASDENVVNEKNN
jgi:hypothetical protein